MSYKRKPNLIIYLIFGIVITSLVTTVTLSRYMTNASGNGTVTVATLDTDVASFSFVPTALNQPGATETMYFNIVNFNGVQVSEVKQNYSITINTIGNLPFTYELECVDTGDSGIGINQTKSVVNTNTKINGGQLNHFDPTTHKYELTITWDSSLDNIEYMEELELITIMVDSEQVLN